MRPSALTRITLFHSLLSDSRDAWQRWIKQFVLKRPLKTCPRTAFQPPEVGELSQKPREHRIFSVKTVKLVLAQDNGSRAMPLASAAPRWTKLHASWALVPETGVLTRFLQRLRETDQTSTHTHTHRTREPRSSCVTYGSSRDTSAAPRSRTALVVASTTYGGGG